VSLTSEEIFRKLLHGFALVLPAAIFYGPEILHAQPWLISLFLGFLLVVSLSIEAIRFRSSSFSRIFNYCFGSMLRSAESTKLTGATFVIGGSFLCSLLAIGGKVPAASAFLGLSLFILGDAAAALVGKAIGRRRIGEKTLEGAFGCFALCLLLVLGVFPYLPEFALVWGNIHLLQAVFLSALVAVLELFPFRVGKIVLNDNLYVPVIVTFVCILIHG
jgi:dolichol kinase